MTTIFKMKMTNNCSRHKTCISGYNDTEQLAEEIGNLHYKSLCEFVYHLRQKLKKDANKDRSGGRLQLADALSDASESLSSVEYNIEKAWDISRPFMEVKNHENTVY